MEINAQIWGGENDRVRFDNWTTADSPYYAKRSSLYIDLGGFANANVLPYNTFPDNSYVYAGQAASVTPWGDMQVYYLPFDWVYGGGATWKDDIISNTPVWENESAIAYYYYPKNQIAEPNVISGISSIIAESPTGVYNTGYYRWIPDGHAEADTPENNNAPLRPIVDFHPRFTYGVIKVRYFDKQSDNFGDVTLYEFKTNYTDSSRYYIALAYLELMHCTSWTNESDNTYDTASVGTFPWSVGCSDTSVKNLKGDYLSFTSGLSNTNSILPLVGMFGTWTVDSDSHYYGVEFESYNPTSETVGYCSKAPVAFSKSVITLKKLAWETYDDRRTYKLFYQIDNTADNIEYLYRAAAAYGLFFTDGKTDLTSNANRWIHEDMYLGLLRDGVGYGDFTRGTGNIDNPVYNWSSSHDSGYNPSEEHDPNTYSDTTNFNTVSLKQAFTRRYALTSAEVQSLAGKLWDANATKDPTITMNDFTLDEYLTNNPIDCIVSLKYFPCSFFTQLPLPLTPLYLGKYDTGMLVYAVDKEVRVIDFAPIKVFRHFGDFRDFEPYTQLQMYIPFCGTVSIPCAEAMGKYVSVKLVIDVSTGACSGFVLVSNSGTGGICVATATGTAAIDLPVSGLQSANLSQAIFNATANWTQTQISNGKIGGGLLAQSDSFIGTMARGYSKSLGSGVANSAVSLARGNLSAGVNILSALDPTKAIETGLMLDLENARAKYNLTHVEMPMRLIGSASPMLSAVLETVCRLIIYRPRTDENALASYADTVGYACCKSGVVSDFSGFTVGTIDVSGINATQEEKAAIAAAFASGVYL